MLSQERHTRHGGRRPALDHVIAERLDPAVLAHTIVMSCEELLRTWYVKKDIYVPFDYRIMIEDEYQRQYLDKIREKYNFFKHADRDIDAKIEVDPEEMHKLNEMMLGLTISGYRAIFSDATPATGYSVTKRFCETSGQVLSLFLPRLPQFLTGIGTRPFPLSNAPCRMWFSRSRISSSDHGSPSLTSWSGL